MSAVITLRGKCKMATKGYTGPVDLATITKVVNQYCAKQPITDVREREYVAVQAFQIFQEGIVEPDDILERLEGPSRAA